MYNIPIKVEAKDGDHSDPLSVYYDGPFIPIPYSNPDEAEWKDWYTVLEDYVDGRSGVGFVRDDKAGTVRGGGYDLKGFWEGEIRCGVESLGIRPVGWDEGSMDVA
jgi:CDK-activating kinase assembly factor MAT1